MGGGGGRVGGEGSIGGSTRQPQSSQSVAIAQSANKLPGPPSSQKPSDAYVQVLPQAPSGGDGDGDSGGNDGAGHAGGLGGGVRGGKDGGRAGGE